MTMKASGTPGQAWEKRWREYCQTLQTIESLEEAIQIARASATQQLDEVRVLVEDEMRGPAPTGYDVDRSYEEMPPPHRRP